MNDQDASTAYPLGPALDFLAQLWQLNHALERLSGRMDRALGVTAQQRFIIRCVGKYPGITAGTLARVLHLDPGTISATLQRLEAKGQLERRRDDRDRRRVTIGLTPTGVDLDRAATGTVEHAVEALLETCIPGHVGITCEILGLLTRMLDAEDEAADVPRGRHPGSQARDQASRRHSPTSTMSSTANRPSVSPRR